MGVYLYPVLSVLCFAGLGMKQVMVAIKKKQMINQNFLCMEYLSGSLLKFVDLSSFPKTAFLKLIAS